MKLTFCQGAVLLCLLIAGCLAATGTDGWGWFLFVAVLFA